MNRILRPTALLALCLALGTVSVAGQSDTVPPLRLEPGDQIRVTVWPDTTLGGAYVIEESGSIYLPAVGQIEVVGRSMTDLRDELVERYSESMRAPVVTVLPLFRVSLLGEVGAPGLYMVDPTLTLLDLVSRAGGFTEEANPQALRLIRSGQVFTVDAEAALELGTSAADMELRSGDRVVVPRGSGVTLSSALSVLQTATALVTLIVVLSNASN